MVRNFSMWVVAGLMLCGGRVYAQDANMAAGGSEGIWRGTLANAAAGSSLDQGTLSSDGRRDLIIGAPGVNSAAGKVFVIFGGNIPTGDLSLSSADVVFHGAGTSDRFGTATAAGSILTTEESDDPRDLLVGALVSSEARALSISSLQGPAFRRVPSPRCKRGGSRRLQGKDCRSSRRSARRCARDGGRQRRSLSRHDHRRPGEHPRVRHSGRAGSAGCGHGHRHGEPEFHTVGGDQRTRYRKRDRGG